MLPIISRTKSSSTTLTTIGSFIATHEFAHIVSLNPENMVAVTENLAFRKVCDRAEIIIADGVGILYAAHILDMPVGDKITGIDLMSELIHIYPEKRIVFLGAHHNAAELTRAHFARKLGISGAHWKAFSDVDKDDARIIDAIVQERPELLFVAFGSPAQELWIEKNRSRLKGSVCMGVGQAFNVYGGIVRRAPLLIQSLGMEWLFRLVTQPWRWKRQLRLFKFIYLVIRYRLCMR